MRAQLEESLSLLHCESFDLYQMHAVTDLDELDARAGALDAIMAARDEGLCRFVGITGHNLTTPAAQLEALRRYDLDTVMFPVNPRLWADAAYRHDAEALLAEAEERDVGVMAIKAVAARPWGERPHTAVDVVRGLHRRRRDRPRRCASCWHPRCPRPVHAERPGSSPAADRGGGDASSR